jgi:flavin-dependent dehydrogenase
MGLGSAVRAEANPIGAARIGGPRGPVVELRSRYQAAVLLRERFDELLALEAVRRGARLRDGVRVREIVRERGRLVGVRTDDGEIAADAVVVANGAKTTFARARRPGQILHTYMAWYEGVDGVNDSVELYFDAAVRPHYGWLFPEGGHRVNIGVVFPSRRGRPNARERFDDFVALRLGDRMRKATRIGRPIGHPVAISWRPTRLVEQGLLVAGEAGSLVDPATAEGIHHALASGWVAGQQLGELAELGCDLSVDNLLPYTRRVRRMIGKRLMAGAALMQLARTPLFGWTIGFGGLKPVRSLLTWTLAGS